jgi:hypothetical protein
MLSTFKINLLQLILANGTNCKTFQIARHFSKVHKLLFCLLSLFLILDIWIEYKDGHLKDQNQINSFRLSTGVIN